jgi:transketolase
MTYEARNLASNLGMETRRHPDYNGFGIDGPIFEVMPAPYVNHWFALAECGRSDSPNQLEVASASRLTADGFGTRRPTVVIVHTIKGTEYGRLEGSGDSHGTPLPHAEYVDAMRKLGFAIPGVKGEVAKDIAVVVEGLGGRDIAYLTARLRAAAALVVPEGRLVERMQTALAGRPMRDYTSIERPAELPAELIFQQGEIVATRKASEAWFAWAMKQTAFFYVGAGDLMKSILTGKAENVYGILSPGNQLGRGIRFGIAEQNMAMMSCATAGYPAPADSSHDGLLRHTASSPA